MIDRNCRQIAVRICFASTLLILTVTVDGLADHPPNSEARACFRADSREGSLRAVPCDTDTLKAAATSGEVYAQNQMGLVSALQLEKGQNIREARSWFEKAARRGYAPAQVNLAVTYINGRGATQNYGAALGWLLEAAKQNHPRAFANLGILYLNGWGVRRDYAQAFQYLELAATDGDAGAQANLGYLYDGGLGVVRDYAAAARWYRLSAEQGNAVGQNNLADLLLRGLGEPQSYSEAFHWFWKSAQQGYTAAQIKLGFLLMNGLGTSKDPSAAYSWILAASKAGDHRGDEYLETLKSQLDPQQLAQANSRSQSLSVVSISAVKPQSAATSFVP